MSFGTDPGATGEGQRKAELFMAKAEAARAAHQAGRKSPLRRLLSRLLRHSAAPEAAKSRASHEA